MKENKLTFTLILAIALVFTGCASYELQKTGDITLTPREPDCEFTIYTQKPEKEYDEIGYVDLFSFGNGWTRDIQKAKRRAQDAVCQAGGNAIILSSNEIGEFTSGTVVFIKE